MSRIDWARKALLQDNTLLMFGLNRDTYKRKVQIMQQDSERKKLSKAMYERLCREACVNPKAPASDETVEDAYWWSICQRVYHYLGVEFMFIPVENASRGDVYRYNLQQLVHNLQSEFFDSLAIPSKYINEAMGKTSSEDGGTA